MSAAGMLLPYLALQRRVSPDLLTRRLSQLVEHAYQNVRYYRELMMQAQVHPEDIRTIADFVACMPTTNSSYYRSMQQDNGHEFMLDQRQHLHNLIRYNSSGSSGIPISIYRTQQESAHDAAKTFSHLVRAGLRPWHRTLSITNPLQVVDEDSILQRIGIFQRHTRNAMTDSAEVLDFVKNNRINAIYGNVAYIEELADRLNESRKSGVRLQLLMPGAGHITESRRRYLKNSFCTARYSEIYGATETGIIASRSNGYYQPDFNSIFFSLKDPVDDGAQTRGSIVLTALHSFAQPILNLAIGDIVSVDNYAQHLVLKSRILTIEGRDNDFLLLDDGKRMSATIFYKILESFDFIRQFQIIQERPGHCDILLKLTAAEARRNLTRVTDSLNHYGRGQFEFDIKIVDAIAPQPNGKRKVFISLLPRRFDPPSSEAHSTRQGYSSIV